MLAIDSGHLTGRGIRYAVRGTRSSVAFARCNNHAFARMDEYAIWLIAFSFLHSVLHYTAVQNEF